MPACCCCGYVEKHGVFIQGQNDRKAFACERCFSHPDLWFPAKKILSHWVTTKKLSRKMLKLIRDRSQKQLSFFLGETILTVFNK